MNSNAARPLADAEPSATPLPIVQRRGVTPMAPTELELHPIVEADILLWGEDAEDAAAAQIARRVLAMVDAMSQLVPNADLDRAYRNAMRAFREAA